MNRYQCGGCKTYSVIASNEPKLTLGCKVCSKDTEHTKFTGTITATNKPERAFISSFAEVLIPAAAKSPDNKPAEVKPVVVIKPTTP